jgi:SAM-dependent methyltransferase
VGDLRALDLPDATFDVARGLLVLLHVEHPDVAVGEIVRVLQPGGRFVCTDVDHQMDAVDASDVALAERVFRGRYADLRNPRIGRQLYGLFVDAGLVDLTVEVVPAVETSWAAFRAQMGETGPTAFELAVTRGDASLAEVIALEADLESRGADGRFFACTMAVRCSGVKP